jgi:hypothetical protein
MVILDSNYSKGKAYLLACPVADHGVWIGCWIYLLCSHFTALVRLVSLVTWLTEVLKWPFLKVIEDAILLEKGINGGN